MIGRPAAAALTGAGYRLLDDLPADLAELSRLHGVGPAAIERLRGARS